MKKYNLNIEQAEIRESGLSSKAGWVKTYVADSETREFMNANMEYLYFDVSVSASAYTDAPELPTKPDLAIVRSADEKSWLHVADHRGKTAYHTETRQATEIDYIGELKADYTLLEPKTEFDKWNGKKWVTDKDAMQAAAVAEAEQQKSTLINEAKDVISSLQDSVDLEIATEEEAAKLKEWKTYRVMLNRVDTSTAPDIEWPTKPV